MKFRILKKEYNNGKVKFIHQYKKFLFWHDTYDIKFNSGKCEYFKVNYEFSTLEEAKRDFLKIKEDFLYMLKRDKKGIKRKSVVYED